jgi:hypothetical protein
MADRMARLGVALLTAAGWVVVAFVVLTLPVTTGAQAVLYAAGFVAVAGSVALILDSYYARGARRVSRPGTIGNLGVGMRFAFTFEFGLWLQSLRMLTAAYAVLLIAGFLALEILFQYAAQRQDRPRE